MIWYAASARRLDGDAVVPKPVVYEQLVGGRPVQAVGSHRVIRFTVEFLTLTGRRRHAGTIQDGQFEFISKHLTTTTGGSGDPVREMLKAFAEKLTSAEAPASLGRLNHSCASGENRKPSAPINTKSDATSARAKYHCSID